MGMGSIFYGNGFNLYAYTFEETIASMYKQDSRYIQLYEVKDGNIAGCGVNATI